MGDTGVGTAAGTGPPFGGAWDGALLPFGAARGRSPPPVLIVLIVLVGFVVLVGLFALGILGVKATEELIRFHEYLSI